MKSENITATEYLQKVLKEWQAFCEGHRSFEKAIIEILDENEQLKLKLRQIENKTVKGFLFKIKAYLFKFKTIVLGGVE